MTGGWAMPDQPRRPSTTVLAGAAGIVALFLVLGVVILVRGGGGASHAPARSSAGAARGDTETLTRANVRWMEVEGIPMPTSDAGPARTEGRRAVGFARTPAGAVLAGIHISLRSLGPEFGPAVFRPTIDEQVVGVDKDQLLRSVEKEYETARVGGLTPTGGVVANLSRIRVSQSRLIGYRIESFDPSQGALQLLGELRPAGAERVFVSMAVTTRWEAGDWKIVAPLNGDSRSSAARLPTVPAGFTVFGDQ